MIDDKHPKLSLTRQCGLLRLNRSSLYYKPADLSAVNVELMNQIRDLWHAHPFYGYRRITAVLQRMGYQANRKRVKRLMDLMGLEAIYPKPKTSQADPTAKKYPYLLGGLAITAANHVWCVDITYLKLGKGFMYLTALIDLYSRYVVGWCLSNSLDTEHCLEALETGLLLATPDIINSDQGCQFTSYAWIEALENRGILVSMDGKGRYLDNIYIERFWRSVKYEEFYLNSYDSVKDLRQAITAYIEFYNHSRPHQSLAYRTPVELYREDKGELTETVKGIQPPPQDPLIQYNKNQEEGVK